MNRLGLARAGVLTSYFGLLGLLLAGIAVFEPPRSTPRALALLIACGPLLFALRGVLHRRPYTHAWLSLLALVYVAPTLANAVGRTQWLPWLLAACSLLLFLSSAFFARFEHRRLRGLQGATAPPG